MSRRSCYDWAESWASSHKSCVVVAWMTDALLRYLHWHMNCYLKAASTFEVHNMFAHRLIPSMVCLGALSSVDLFSVELQVIT